MTGGRLGVGIIGMGHVGPVLGSALRAAGHSIVGVSASSEASRERAEIFLPGVPILDVMEVARRAELVLLTVPDDELESLVSGLAALGVWQSGQLVIHTSGAHGIDVLAPAQRAGAIPLAIHPAMTFTGTSVDIARLVGTPFGVTAPAYALPIAQALVIEMGGEPVEIAENQRALYHAALSHGANAMATIVVQAMHTLRTAGISDPGNYLRPLCEAALDRALREEERGISGPVRRADVRTIRRHLRAFDEAQDAYVQRAASGDSPNGEEGELDAVAAATLRDTYRHMSDRTVDILHRNGHMSDRDAENIRRALSEEASENE